jgi:hypothetical protein
MAPATTRPSAKTLVVGGAWVVLLAAGLPTFVDLDAWHLMALARESIQLGHVPLDERFAYTPTVHPSVQHEWGTGMVLLFLATHGGIVALQAARVALMALVVVLAVRASRRRGAAAVDLLVLAPPAIVMSWIGFTAIRPQVFTLAFLALWLGWLEDDRRGRRSWVPWALASQIAWQNLHAGFVVGLGFVLLHAAEQAWRRAPIGHLLALLAIAPALIVVNPYGLAYYPFLAHALTMARPLIGEWRPIWEANPVALGVWATSVAIALLTLARVGLPAARGWPILLASIYLSARHERHVSIYALVWFVTVPALFAATRVGAALRRAWERPATVPMRALAAVLIAFAVTVAARHRPWRLSVPGIHREGAPAPYPVGPVEYLAAHQVTGNLLVPFVSGAYVSWKLHPRIKVSIDSRYEVAYPPERLDEHVAFYTARSGWDRLLERYPTDMILVRHADAVAAALSTHPGWKAVYRDDAFALYARKASDFSQEDRRGQQILGTFP